MITNSLFTYACAGVIGLLLGTLLTVAGYRFFLFVLPIWGFFFGFTLGAQTMQALFGVEFLATITSWVVGFFAGAIFAVLAYMFYLFAVAFISGSLGYLLAVGLLTWIGLPLNFIVWLIGIAAAIALAFVTIRFNLQKWVVIAATSIMGAGAIFGTILLMFNPMAALLANPVKLLLETSPWLALLFLLVAGLGIYVQVVTTKTFEVDVYNRVTAGSESE
jgi:hypothetical protein